MHNRKRAVLTAEQTAALAKKVDTYRRLYTVAMKQKAASAMTDDAFHLNGEFLALSPDTYSLWNYRRSMLMARLAAAGAPVKVAVGAGVGWPLPAPSTEGAVAAGGADVSTMVAGELKVTAAAIQRNPKSYGAWHHRAWVVANFTPYVHLADELVLCGRLLDADERNFHCWNYRRWVAQVSAATAEEELACTTERIVKNFSNYSAWHYRSAALAALHAGCGSGGEGGRSALPLPVVADELNLVRQALFTEPDDQSAWIYHRWVVSKCALPHVALPPAATTAITTTTTTTLVDPPSPAHATLLADLLSLYQLRAASPGSKWPIIAVATTLQHMGKSGVTTSMLAAWADSHAEGGGMGGDGYGDAKATAVAVKALNRDLTSQGVVDGVPTDGGALRTVAGALCGSVAGMDPMRAACYNHLGGRDSA